MWKQTVWGAVVALAGVIGLVVYFAIQADTDYEAIRFLAELGILIPALLAVAYMIRRLIERKAN